MPKKLLPSILSLVLLIVGLGVSLKLVGQGQDVREKAQTVDTLIPRELIIQGEAIIKYKEGNNPSEVKEAVDRRRQTRDRGTFGKAQISFEDLVTKAKGDTSPELKQEQIEKAEKDLNVAKKQEVPGVDSPKETNLNNLQLIKTEGELSFQEIKTRYQTVTAVQEVLPNIKMEARAIPNDEYYPQMWGLKKIESEKAWDVSKGSSSVIVAVVDSGIDYTHDDLGNSLNENFFNSRVVGGYDFGDDDSIPMDLNGHGTHVAGTIGAVTNNQLGVSGINWDVKLLAVKVFSDSGGSGLFEIVSGIMYAADNGAKVINMSLGQDGVPCSLFPEFQAAVDYARSKGVTIVVASGNANADTVTDFPSSCNGVIAVSATDTNDKRPYFSNWGSFVDISAPGVNILSTYPAGSYQTLSGTSMASPHVAGAAAILLAKDPNLTPDQIEVYLENNADPITTDKPIAGRLNLYNSLIAVGAVPTPTKVPTPSPTPTPVPTLNFGQTLNGIICCPNGTETWQLPSTSSGTSITINVQAVSGDLYPFFTLIAPSGATETQSFKPSTGTAVLQSYSLKENGVYKVVVKDSDSGYPQNASTYKITLSSGVAPTPTPTPGQPLTLDYGQSKNGNVCCPNSTETWQLPTSSAGTVISIDVSTTTPGFWPYFNLIAPSGLTETSSTKPTSDVAKLTSWSLKESGVYKVIVKDQDAGYPTSPATYSIYLAPGSMPVSPTPTPTAFPTYTPTPTKIPTPTNTPTSTPVISTTPTPQPGNGGDTNGDNLVDIYDFSNVIEAYGSTGSNNPADFDNDGDVDIFDFNKVIENFGKLVGKLLHFLVT